jgi:hypothetical protein
VHLVLSSPKLVSPDHPLGHPDTQHIRIKHCLELDVEHKQRAA